MTDLRDTWVDALAHQSPHTERLTPRAHEIWRPVSATSGISGTGQTVS
jgi:hypothetical protein